MNDVGYNKCPFGISVLGWALNEEENIQEYIDRVEQYLTPLTDDFELILIDDGSMDRTWAIMQESARTRPWLRIYQNERNRGAGFNAKRAIGLAQKDYLFWQTVDWSYDIGLLGQNLHLLEQCDVLQGVRLNSLSLRGVLQSRSDNPFKGIISIVNYLLVRSLFGLPLHDYQNVTVYPRRLIQAVHLESESSFINPECLLKTWWKGTHFKEVPVAFLERKRGVATGTRPAAIWAAIQDIGRWWWRWIVLGRRQDFGRGKVTYWTGTAAATRPWTPAATGIDDSRSNNVAA